MIDSSKAKLKKRYEEQKKQALSLVEEKKRALESLEAGCA